jgi:hypothetical protein
MVAHFALDFESAGSPMLLLRTRQSLLKLAEPVFGSLCRRSLNYHATDKRFLSATRCCASRKYESGSGAS